MVILLFLCYSEVERKIEMEDWIFREKMEEREHGGFEDGWMLVRVDFGEGIGIEIDWGEDECKELF